MPIWPFAQFPIGIAILYAVAVIVGAVLVVRLLASCGWGARLPPGLASISHTLVSGSQQSTQRILDQLPMALMLVTFKGALIFRNRAARELLQQEASATGGSAEQMMRAWVARLGGYPPLSTSYLQRFDEWLKLGAMGPEVFGDATHRFFEISREPVVDVGVLWILHDVSPYKQLELTLRLTTGSLEQRVLQRTQALQDARVAAELAQLSKTRFFAAASHDLLQPLNAARIFASTLAEQSELTASTRQMAERIDTALRSAEEVIDVLVDVAKLDTGAVRAVIEDVDLHDLLRGMIEQFSSIAAARNLKLTLGPCRYIVRSDRRLLRRVLQNLISNALRYTAEGGVLIGVRRQFGSRLRLDVVDSGQGIPAEALSQVFEEFRRIGRGSPWGEKGLGLGLAICDRICALLGHQLRVQSVLGRGSVFGLSLGVGRPDATQTAALAAPLPERVTQPRLSLRILCVDDDAGVLDAMVTLVSGWGAQAQGANSRVTALSVARDMRPDVLLVDYQFDGEECYDGLDVIAAVCDLYPQAGPAAILITADRSEALRERTRQLDIALLHKPLKAARLRALLEARRRH